MSDPMTSFLMEPGCPWVNLRTSTGVPDILWCERQLCSWIATPADTWSNLGYVIVGFFFFLYSRKEKSENLRFYGPAAQWVGWTSFIYHASLTYVTQVLDFVGMYVYFYLVLVQNFARLGFIPANKVKKNVWIFTWVTTIVSAFAAKHGVKLQPFVMALILFILITEVLATRKATRKVSHLYMILSFAFLSVAAAFSASDYSRRFCDPDNHWIQGHALWHVLGAFALFFSLFHYKQFYSPTTGKLET